MILLLFVDKVIVENIVGRIRKWVKVIFHYENKKTFSKIAESLSFLGAEKRI